MGLISRRKTSTVVVLFSNKFNRFFPRMSCKSFPKFLLTGDKQKLNTSSDFVNQLYDYRPTELFYMPISYPSILFAHSILSKRTKTTLHELFSCKAKLTNDKRASP